MNRSDAIRQERERLMEQLGYYVTLDQAAIIMKTASKVVSTIAGASYGTSYQEARLILFLADRSLREISGGGE